eukprot:698396-Amphidinium_carterae.1
MACATSTTAPSASMAAKARVGGGLASKQPHTSRGVYGLKHHHTMWHEVIQCLRTGMVGPRIARGGATANRSIANCTPPYLVEEGIGTPTSPPPLVLD